MNTLGKKKFDVCIKLNIRVIQVYSDSLLGVFYMQFKKQSPFSISFQVWWFLTSRPRLFGYLFDFFKMKPHMETICT